MIKMVRYKTVLKGTTDIQRRKIARKESTDKGVNQCSKLHHTNTRTKTRVDYGNSTFTQLLSSVADADEFAT